MGDVLYIKDGVTTGIAMVNTLDEEFTLLSSVALLKQDRSIIDGHFLCGVLNNDEMYTDIRNNESLNQLANWSYYSKKGFRGFCLQTKEELEETIIQELALEKDDFEVINGDPELYVPS